MEVLQKLYINIINPAAVLADGTIIIVGSGYGYLAVDINGMKKPNKWGYDLFAFALRPKIIPYGFSDKGGKVPEVMFKEALGGSL
jgi:hypothetical protein